MNITRHLILILGDQLNLNNPALDGFDPAQDQLLMIEAREESSHVPSHKARILAFLSAMRHFADTLREHFGTSSLTYIFLEDNPHPSLTDTLISQLRHYGPQRLRCQHPGDYRLKHKITQAAQTQSITLEWCQDRHFLCSQEDFRHWAGNKRTLRMETFYRWMRQRTGILMRPDGQPEGDTWNMDQHNRAAFSAQGPGLRPANHSVLPDTITQQVITLIEGEQIIRIHLFEIAFQRTFITAIQTEYACRITRTAGILQQQGIVQIPQSLDRQPQLPANMHPNPATALGMTRRQPLSQIQCMRQGTNDFRLTHIQATLRKRIRYHYTLLTYTEPTQATLTQKPPRYAHHQPCATLHHP